MSLDTDLDTQIICIQRTYELVQWLYEELINWMKLAKRYTDYQKNL